MDIAITIMNPGLVQVYQVCMIIGESLSDMTAGNIGTTVTDMADGREQM